MTEPHDNTSPGTQALGEALAVTFRALRAAMVLLLLAYLASGLFVVRQHEKALVLRLGRVTGIGADRVKGPGVHWTWPRPFCEIVRMPAERVQSLPTSTFWRSRRPEFQEEDAAPVGATLDPEREGYVLTGDANIVHARWAVRYTINDPERYAFGFADPGAALARELDAAVVRVSACYPIDRALRTDVVGLREAVERELVARTRARALGVRVQGVDLLAITPPGQVAEAFAAAVTAEADRAKRISEARAYATRTANEARGQADRIRREGETSRQRMIADIAADAEKFRRLLERDRQQPGFFRQTLLQESVRRALAGAEQKYIVRGGKDGAELRLQLSPEARRPAPAAPPSPSPDTH